MNYEERYVVELEDGTFALWGQFDGKDHTIMPMSKFWDGTLFRKEYAEMKVVQINKGTWEFQGETRRATGIRKIEMKMI